eukprot:2273393-Prymnesium_polylepis.1
MQHKHAWRTYVIRVWTPCHAHAFAHGECFTVADWSWDVNIDIPVLTRVMYREFVGVVQASDASTVTIEFIEMYKPDEGNSNALRRCHVDLSSDLFGRYPEDCRFDLVPQEGGGSFRPWRARRLLWDSVLSSVESHRRERFSL